MDLGLRDRVALVSAASQGLGKAAALALAREGARVVICSRDAGKLEQARKEISDAVPGSRVVPRVADVTVAGQVAALVRETLEAEGRLDILVTNAGGPPVGSFLDLDDAQWHKGIDLSLLSVVRLIRAVVPHMQRQHWGRIINISSSVAKQPVADLVISSGVRPGVLGLSRALATQLGREGVLINTVLPGSFLTDRQRQIGQSRAAASGISFDAYLSEVSREIPVGRMGDPEELASVIAFLASERASYVTGAVIAVDGGSTRGLL